jgi:hypothetical protein
MTGHHPHPLPLLEGVFGIYRTTTAELASCPRSASERFDMGYFVGSKKPGAGARIWWPTELLLANSGRHGNAPSGRRLSFDEHGGVLPIPGLKHLCLGVGVA